MSTLATTDAVPERATLRTRFALRGPAWLVWREHCPWFLLWAVCSVIMTGYLVYWHVRYHATFAELTNPGPSVTIGLPPDFGLWAASFLLTIAPAVAGVTFGAPLFEREYTNGTARLVFVQSVTDSAWVRAKLLVPAVVVIACVTPCAAALTWDFRVDYALQQNWLGIGVFNAIGPAAVGLSLVGLFLGAATGLTWRRSAPSKIVALVLVIAFEAAVFRVLPHLLPSAHATATAADQSASAGPQAWIPDNAWLLSSGYQASAGRTATAGASYLPYSDLDPMQWIATGICIGVCGALAIYCQWLIQRRRG